MSTFAATSRASRSTMSNLVMNYPKANLQPFAQNFSLKFDSSPVAMESSGTQVQRKLSKSESIHSGHFMVSEIEENDQEKNKSTAAESDYEREEDTRILSNYEFKTKEDTQTYVYGSRSSSCVQIDSSLTKLFEC